MYKTKLVALYLTALFASVAFGDNDPFCSVTTCGEVGGSCDDTTFCPLPTTCRDGICRYDKEGDNCTLTCTGTETYCKNKKCVAYVKEGGDCSEYECQSGLKCGDDKVCRHPPETKGSECSSTIGCDLLSGLVCIDGTCQELPGEGKECYNKLCKGELKCDANNKCVKPPKKGESCDVTLGCRGTDVYCAYDIIAKNGVCTEYPGLDEECTLTCKTGYVCTLVDSALKCKKNNPVKGDYCSVAIPCRGSYECEDNVCVESKTCSAYDDCTGFPNKICSNGKCVDSMTVEEGGKCSTETILTIDSVVASTFQCKEGHGCVDGKCLKIETKLSDAKNCSSCPSDSRCLCNDKDGRFQCVPYPYADKGIRSDVKSYYDLKDECAADTKVCEKAISKLSSVNSKINNKFYSYTFAKRCDLIAAASSVKVSFALLMAVLFFFSL